MGRVNHGRSQLRAKPRDLCAHLNAHLGVLVGQWLIEEKHLRITHDRPAPVPLAGADRPIAPTRRFALLNIIEPKGLGGVVDCVGDKILCLLRQLQPRGHVVEEIHMRIKRIALEHHKS